MHTRPLRTLTAPARGLLALLLGATMLLVSACGTGFDAQTNKVYQSGVGATDRDGQVDLLNALLVDNADGTATLSTGLINQQSSDETLTDVTAKSGGKEIEIALDAPLELPSERLVKAGSLPQVVVRDDDVGAGSYVTLTLSFESSTPVEIDVPVVKRTGMYSEVALSPDDPGSSQPSDGATEDFPSDENTVEPQG